MTERYIFITELARGERISVTVDGEITRDLLDALESYVKRHKAAFFPDELLGISEELAPTNDSNDQHSKENL